MSAPADTVNYWQPRGALRMGPHARKLKGLWMGAIAPFCASGYSAADAPSFENTQ
jgi:hypothetical protein